VKRDIKDFVSKKCGSKYYTVNKLPGFPDAQNANLFMIYAKVRFQIKVILYLVPIFYLIISGGSMFDLTQFLISKTITSQTLLAHYVNYL
jgi:hypothetical protein